MNNINVFSAFAAGVLSFLSPCVFLLLPAFISHLTGSSVQDGKLVVNRGKMIFLSLFSYFAGSFGKFYRPFLCPGTRCNSKNKRLIDYYLWLTNGGDSKFPVADVR
ncbi:cytochrome c biogenesis CcdA family protein [Paenibacillus sp. 37]|uniref:cytochrome c biogenesis CcdA family protein n=1 Tax=Paenibacillus sp. 37 TaxID=2607911 RepID=UPI002948BCCC|nr:cytochrome c biogenesis protein CcdA [Paenibacillus sp. 37]